MLLDLENVRVLEVEFNFTPVSVNSAYRTFRGRIIKSKKLKEFERKMDLVINELNGRKIQGLVKITVDIDYCDRRKRDLDNALKSVIDSIKNRLIEDDHNIYEIVARKRVNCAENKTKIIIEKL